jgi:hypothetical protein
MDRPAGAGGAGGVGLAAGHGTLARDGSHGSSLTHQIVAAVGGRLERVAASSTSPTTA